MFFRWKLEKPERNGLWECPFACGIDTWSERQGVIDHCKTYHRTYFLEECTEGEIDRIVQAWEDFKF